MLFFWVVGFSLLGSIGSIAGASLLLVFPDAVRRQFVPCLISYASGTLIGAAFLGMIPASIQGAPVRDVMTTVLFGLVLFFILEKLVIWRHCHEQDCEAHGRAAPLILIGDAFHNLVDGIVIAAAFLTSIPLGITASIAVIAHEIPQEVGDFAILLESGYSRSKALLLNTLSSITTLPGAVVAYFWLAEAEALKPYVLAISAASFIYIAIADLIPSLHKKGTIGEALRQTILLAFGIATIALLHH